MLLGVALFTVPKFGNYIFLTFNPKFFFVNLSLTFVASYMRITIYEYLKETLLHPATIQADSLGTSRSVTNLL